MKGSGFAFAIVGAVVAILAITAAVILLAQDNASAVQFLAVATPTVLALLALIKSDSVQNDVQEVSTAVAELTNGKLHEAVHSAVVDAVADVVDHSTGEFSAIEKGGGNHG